MERPKPETFLAGPSAIAAAIVEVQFREAWQHYATALGVYADHLERQLASVMEGDDEDRERMERDRAAIKGLRSISEARLQELLRLEEENTALREKLGQLSSGADLVASAKADQDRMAVLRRAVEGGQSGPLGRGVRLALEANGQISVIVFGPFGEGMRVLGPFDGLDEGLDALGKAMR